MVARAHIRYHNLKACLECGRASAQDRVTGGSVSGLWRAGRGEYRARYAIDEAEHLVRVLDVDHRRDA